ncbi:MAG TPA: hypothetical protein VMZ31_02860 [Phycisphaerae bacterium]|nr:hypothetical protein [Phycisphaerae bacterium]
MSETPIRDWYLRRIVGNVPLMLRLFDADAGCFRCEPGHDRDYQHAVRPLAYLYAHKIDGNPYHQDASILDKVIREGDAIWRHLEQMKLVSNYLSTAPNHFIWRAALSLRRAAAAYFPRLLDGTLPPPPVSRDSGGTTTRLPLWVGSPPAGQLRGQLPSSAGILKAAG